MYYMSGYARFILVNNKQDLLGKNTVDNIGTFVLKGNELISFVNCCTSFVKCLSWTHTFSNPRENFTKNSHQSGPKSVKILWGLLNVCVQDKHFSKYYSDAPAARQSNINITVTPRQSNINITLTRDTVILFPWLHRVHRKIAIMAKPF